MTQRAVGLVGDDPASRVELPVARRPRAVVWTAARVEHWQRTGERPPGAVWTAAQTAEFLHAIRDHRLYAAFHLIALRGLRRGEAAGLRWCDVDLDQQVAVISQQIQQHDLRHGAAMLALAAGVELKVVQDMLGQSSIVLTADTCTSVLPEVAHRAAEKTARHVMKAGRLIPGANRLRRRDTGRRKRRKTGTAPTRASMTHPARQLGRPQRC